MLRPYNVHKVKVFPGVSHARVMVLVGNFWNSDHKRLVLSRLVGIAFQFAFTKIIMRDLALGMNQRFPVDGRRIHSKPGKVEANRREVTSETNLSFEYSPGRIKAGSNVSIRLVAMIT